MVVRLLKRLGGLSLAVLLIMPSGYAFVVGIGRLALWSMAQQPNQYAVAYPYLLDAGPWMALGLLGLIGSLAVMTSGQRSWRWLWFPAITALYCFLVIPFQPSYGWFIHHAHHPMSTLPIVWAQDLTRHDFLRITGDLTDKAKSRGGFSCPGNDLKDPQPLYVGRPNTHLRSAMRRRSSQTSQSTNASRCHPHEDKQRSSRSVVSGHDIGARHRRDCHLGVKFWRTGLLDP